MEHETIKPTQKKVKFLITKIMFYILAQTIQAASRFDPQIKQELMGWTEEYKVLMKVQENGPTLSLEYANGILNRKAVREHEADILISVKNIEFAFKMITMRTGTVQALWKIDRRIKEMYQWPYH